MKKYAAYPALVLAGGAAAFALRLAQNRTGFEAATGLPVAGNVWGRLLVGLLGGDFPRTAQLFSKEIENDAGNMDALLDAAYEHPAFTDARLLGMLLQSVGEGH